MSVIVPIVDEGRTPPDWLAAIEPGAVMSLSYGYAKRHQILVASISDHSAQVLTAGMPALSVLAELRRQLGLELVVHKVDQHLFDRLLRQGYDKGQSEATQMVDDLGEDVDLAMLAHELPQTTDLLDAADDAPIVRLINALITQAVRENASDIHLEAFDARSLVRFRIDGLLRDIVEPQRALHSALVSRLKVMAQLDIAEKRLPQDGRISLRVGDRPVDVRVSTLPTQHGERVVLRLLDIQGARLNIEDLGMDPGTSEHFNRLIQSPHGIILVTGPTGSGKTTTLYAGLSRLDRLQLNILTIEDPIEYDIDGVGQTQVHSKIDLTFANGLRSILRQDPDVVLVGEIRDLETAEIAVQASLTGHLVLTTLHTNSAVGAVTRLVDMGIGTFLIASSLLGVLAQRLVRQLCEHCREPFTPDVAQLQLLGASGPDGIELYRPQGCNHCEYTGYRGRTGIYELIVVDDGLRSMIHDNHSEAAMVEYARRDSPSILENGLNKVRQGVTSLDEVLRVTTES